MQDLREGKQDGSRCTIARVPAWPCDCKLGDFPGRSHVLATVHRPRPGPSLIHCRWQPLPGTSRPHVATSNVPLGKDTNKPPDRPVWSGPTVGPSPVGLRSARIGSQPIHEQYLKIGGAPAVEEFDEETSVKHIVRQCSRQSKSSTLKKA